MACRIQRKINIALSFVLGILLWGCTDSSIRECQIGHWDKCRLSEIRGGDIILRMGEGFISQMIAWALADSVQLSHCGIVVCRNDSFHVVHSLPKELSEHDGVQICSLEKFVAESLPNSVVVVRPKNLQNEIMEARAWHYLSHPKPFDWDFDVNDSTDFFCSELPLHIWKHEFGVDFCSGSEDYPRFSLFMDTVCFERVYP